MSLVLSNIKPTKAILPPRIVLYSTPKLGKTTLAASIQNNLLLDVEGGSGAVSVARVEREKLDTFPNFMGILKLIYEQKHEFTTLTIDSIDWLEEIIFKQAANEHGKSTIADVGYGAGYVTALNLWRQVLQGLDMLREERGMTILLIAHEVIKRYDNPMVDSYDRYSLKLHDKTVGLIKEWCDLLAFGNNEVFVKSENVGFKTTINRGKAGERILHTVESPSFIAGNRYGLPPEISFSWEALSDALCKAMMENKPEELKDDPAQPSTIPTTGKAKTSKTKGE
jgi:AAA domain